MTDKKAGPVTLAVGLIIFGGILLAANFAGIGVIETSLKFWPVLLIGLGLEYFFRRYKNIRSGSEGETKFHLPTVVMVLLVVFVANGAQQLAGLMRNHDLNNLLTEAVAGSKYSYNYKFENKPIDIKPGTSKLILDDLGGKVDLVPSTDGKLYVQVSSIGWGPTEAEAKRRAEMVKINISEGEVTKVSCDQSQPQNTSRPGAVSFCLMIPNGVNVVVDHGSGSIKADNLRTNMEVGSFDGDAGFSGITGNLALTELTGQVSCVKINGNLEASVSSGNIKVKDISKDVRVNNEDGSIEILSAKPVVNNYNITNKNGDIVFRLPEVSNAAVSAGTKAGSLKGTIKFRTDAADSGEGKNGSGEQSGPEMNGSVVLGTGKAVISIFAENGNITLDKY